MQNAAVLLIFTHQFPFMHDAAVFYISGPTDGCQRPLKPPGNGWGPPTEDGWEGHRDRPVPLQFHP
jgi:hypothetical protein